MERIVNTEGALPALRNAMKSLRDANQPIFVVPDKYEVDFFVPVPVYETHPICGHELNGEFHYVTDKNMQRAQTCVGYGLKTSIKKCSHCTEENEKLRRIRLSAKNLENLFPDADIPSYAKHWTFENFPEWLDAFAVETLAGVTENSIAMMKRGEIGTSVFIHGKTGSGKTSAASSALRRYIQEGYGCLFVPVRKYIRLLQTKMDKRESEPEMAQLESLVLNVPVLVFDDLGSEQPTDWVQGKVFDVIEERGASGLVTIITSNNDLPALRKFWMKTQGASDVQQQAGRIIRRLAQRFHVVPMAGGGEDEGAE